jgi:hypothetical protein
VSPSRALMIVTQHTVRVRCMLFDDDMEFKIGEISNYGYFIQKKLFFSLIPFDGTRPIYFSRDRALK